MSSIFQVGIDFGTSQTKICSRFFNSSKQLVIHEFISNDSIFLPTTITLKDDNTLTYGDKKNYTFSRFKMASLFNEPIKSNNPNNKLVLNPNICCILYLAYCILEIVCKFGKIPHKNNDSKSFQRKNVDFLFVLGIPTEYDRNKSEHLRRSLHYQNLYFAFKLAKQFSTLEEFTQFTVSQFIVKLKEINTDFISLSVNNVEEVYKREGLFLLAETTAGVFLLRNQFQQTFKSLRRNEIPRFIENNMGNYMTLDIGAGTSDISFFILDLIDDKFIRMKYVATKTVDAISTQAVISEYLQTKDKDIIEKYDHNSFKNDAKWEESQVVVRNNLFSILGYHNNKLLDKILNYYQLSFNWHWDYFEGTRGKGCLCYGGGSRFEYITRGEFTMHTATIKIKKYITFKEFSTQFELKDVYGIPINRDTTRDTTSFIKIMKGFDLFPVAIGLSLQDPINKPDQINIGPRTPTQWLDISFLIRNQQEVDSLEKMDLFP